MSVEAVALPLYIVLIVVSYWFLTRVFRRIVDPTGEFGLLHDVPLPGLVRWILLAASLLLPVVILWILVDLARLLLWFLT